MEASFYGPTPQTKLIARQQLIESSTIPDLLRAICDEFGADEYQNDHILIQQARAYLAVLEE